MNDHSGAAPTRILIVDDHEVLSEALAHVLDAQADLSVAGVAHNLAEARSMVVSTAPDVVLLDHRLPDGDGVETLPELRALRPQASFVMLTATTTDSVLVTAIENGAAGFVAKTRGIGDVLGAVRSAAAGEAVISPELLARLLPRLHRATGPVPPPAPAHVLTEREREVLGYLADGLSNAAIAERMFVSVHTVRNHLANLSGKLGAHSKLEALAIAIREDLLPGR